VNTEVVAKFRKIVGSLQGTINILITQVDPDALASAFAMSFLLRFIRGNGVVKIFYAGSVSHRQNLTMCNRLGLYDRMRPATDMKDDDFKNLVLVDSSMSIDGRCLHGKKLNPMIVVDHHFGGDIMDADDRFVLIEKIGASSTLVLELCEDFGVNLGEMDSFIPILIAAGIYTDTLGLTAFMNRDLIAYGKVALVSDQQELMHIFNYPLHESNYKNMRLALENVCRHGAHLITNIGPIDSKDGDDISTAADLLIRMDGVSLVIVWAMIKDRKEVRVSARSTDSSLDLCSYLKERFGASCGSKPTPDKKSSGGGTMSLDLGFWLNNHTVPEAVALVNKFIESAIFH